MTRMITELEKMRLKNEAAKYEILKKLLDKARESYNQLQKEVA